MRANQHEATVPSILTSAWSVLLLDLAGTDSNGTRLVRRLRASGNRRPILALGEDPSREIDVLDAGADDFVLQPTSFEILEARVRALTRRSGQYVVSARDSVQIGGVEFDLPALEVRAEGQEVNLRLGLRRLATLLARRYPDSASYDEITTIVHDGYGDRLVLYRSADELRKAFHPLGLDVQTVRGIGYRLSVLAARKDKAG